MKTFEHRKKTSKAEARALAWELFEKAVAKLDLLAAVQALDVIAKIDGVYAPIEARTLPAKASNPDTDDKRELAEA